MTYFVAAHFSETAGNRLVAVSGSLLGKLFIHCIDFVRLPLNGVAQVVGITADQAYFVKCDDETTTQADIDLGIVNILVGFAPLKPAEFVVIQIEQLTGQAGS